MILHDMSSLLSPTELILRNYFPLNLNSQQTMVCSHVLYPLSYESETTCEGLEPSCRNKRRWISDPEHLPILPTRHIAGVTGFEPAY